MKAATNRGKVQKKWGQSGFLDNWVVCLGTDPDIWLSVIVLRFVRAG
jgi:hypothetical protein